jgi:hypothetical protein
MLYIMWEEDPIDITYDPKNMTLVVDCGQVLDLMLVG